MNTPARLISELKSTFWRSSLNLPTSDALVQDARCILPSVSMVEHRLTPENIQAALKIIPQCGLSCLLGAVHDNSTCAADDFACGCASQPVQSAAALCISRSCSVLDALTTKNLTDSLCGITSHYDGNYRAVLYSVVTIASFCVILRFVARLVKRVPLWWDDYAVLIGVVVAIAFTAVCGIFGNLGVGLDLWAVPQENVSKILILLTAALHCYAVSRCFGRISISLFLLRIFQATNSRRVLYVTMALNVALTIIYIFLIIFQCSPVSYFWNGWDGLHPGSCLDRWPMFLAGGCLAAAVDICLVLAPVYWVLPLQFSLAKKITTAAMLSLGILVVFTSIMRLIALRKFVESHNPTRHLPELAIWGGMELYAAIICATIPSLKPLLTLGFSRVRTWTDLSSSYAKTSRARSSKYPLSGGSQRIPRDQTHEPEHLGVGSSVSSSRHVFLTTAIRQQTARPPSESEVNLTNAPTPDIELYDPKKGASQAQAWA